MGSLGKLSNRFLGSIPKNTKRHNKNTMLEKNKIVQRKPKEIVWHKQKENRLAQLEHEQQQQQNWSMNR